MVHGNVFENSFTSYNYSYKVGAQLSSCDFQATILKLIESWAEQEVNTGLCIQFTFEFNSYCNKILLSQEIQMLYSLVVWKLSYLVKPGGILTHLSDECFQWGHWQQTISRNCQRLVIFRDYAVNSRQYLPSVSKYMYSNMNITLISNILKLIGNLRQIVCACKIQGTNLLLWWKHITRLV